jgi:hypothetical protein
LWASERLSFQFRKAQEEEEEEEEDTKNYKNTAKAAPA